MPSRTVLSPSSLNITWYPGTVRNKIVNTIEPVLALALPEPRTHTRVCVGEKLLPNAYIHAYQP